MKSKKDPILKRIKNWFSLLWLSFTTEVQDRVFMSWKRIIKFLGISIVPIIYGVVCLVAFWNPITGIGRAPMAILNQDQNIILVETIDPDINHQDPPDFFKIGALVNPENGDQWDDPNATFFHNETGEIDNSVENLRKVIAQGLVEGQSYYLNNGLQFKYDKSATILSVVSMWEVMKSMMLPKTDENIRDEDYTFKTAVIAQGMALKNIHYISEPKEIDHEWKGSHYYVQIKLEKNYTANLFGWLGSVVNQKNHDQVSNQIRAPDEWKESLTKMQIWTTFERNFIFGYYMQTFSNFASGMIFQAIPSSFMKLILGNFVSGLTTNGEILNLANGSPLPRVDDYQEYVLIRSADADPSVPNLNEPNVRPYSLFGNINQDGTSSDPTDVGGKFISSIKEMKKIKEIGLIEILETIFGPMSEAMKAIINELFSLLDKIKGNTSEQLNSYIYRGVTGQWTSDDINPNTGEMQKAVLEFLEVLGFKIDNSLIDNLTIFPQAEIINPILTQTSFEDQFSKFMIKNPDVFLGATSLEELPAIIAAKIIGAKTGDITSSDLVGFELQGAKNGLYGIGLGQFFLVIGLWIGVLMHTFVFDRAKRVSKASRSTWYLSKTMLMLSTALIQATIEVWVAYLAGWNMLGLEATFYLWLWFLAASTMFVILIQGLWFVVKDETIGKFMVVIVMVLSLAAGGGTFPAFAQFKFFEIIGYLVPFTYVLKGMGAIIYGVSILGTTANTTAVILQSFAAFFVYIAIFGGLGLFVGAKNRFKEMDYGSHYGHCIAFAMIALKRNPDEIGFRTIKKTSKIGKNKYQYHWEKLKPGLDLELYLKCREMFPFEGRFKWWEKKHHDPVQKPNFSDEEIITRNE